MTHADAPTRPLIAEPRSFLAEQARSVAASAAGRAQALDEAGAFPDEEIRALHRLGLLHAPFPPALGGQDLGSPPGDPLVLMDVLGALGRGSLALGRLYEGHVNAVKLIRLYGSSENLSLVKDEADAGRLTGVWMAEDGTALALRGEGDGRRLDGRKILASGAGHIRRPLIAAMTDSGSQMVLPLVDDRDRVDLSGWTAAGMKATATGTVDFSGLSIEPAAILGKPGDYLRSPHFRGGAWRVMAVQLGGVEALIEAYRRQILAAGRDGDRMQRARFAEALAAAETARLWVREACLRAETSDAAPDGIDAYVDLMRNTVEAAALAVVSLAQKSLGLRAYLAPNEIERIARDLETYLRQPALDASRESAAAFFFHQPLFS